MLHVDQTLLMTMHFLDFAPIFPLTCQLGQSLPLGCVGEFAHVAKASIPLAPTSVSFEIISML
jgi:hypothetical protein